MGLSFGHFQSAQKRHSEGSKFKCFVHKNVSYFYHSFREHTFSLTTRNGANASVTGSLLNTATSKTKSCHERCDITPPINSITWKGGYFHMKGRLFFTWKGSNKRMYGQQKFNNNCNIIGKINLYLIFKSWAYRLNNSNLFEEKMVKSEIRNILFRNTVMFACPVLLICLIFLWDSLLVNNMWLIYIYILTTIPFVVVSIFSSFAFPESPSL